MKDFYGNNDLSPISNLRLERRDYKRNAYGYRLGVDAPMNQTKYRGPQNVKDLNFVENTMYGCINTRMDTVYIPEQNLSPIISNSTEGQSFRVLDFVAPAFNAVVEKFKEACHTNQIRIDDPYLSVIKPVRAYVSPFGLYDEYIDSLMTEYLEEYIVKHNKRKHILNVRQYINHFMIFFKNKVSPKSLTFTSWQRSRKSSIFTSGLAIDIAGLEVDDDRIKQDLFLNNPLHEFFIDVCKSHGFLIPHNVPWVMVADILSPAMSRYSSEELVFSSREVFESKYIVAYKTDITLLKEIFFEYYNRFAQSFEVQNNLGCDCGNNTISSLFFRRVISLEEYENTLKHDDWLNFYAHVRNLEEGKPFSKQKVNKIILRSKNFASSLDKQEDLRYINEEYRKMYVKRWGGLNEYGKRIMGTPEETTNKVGGNARLLKRYASKVYSPPPRPRIFIADNNAPGAKTEFNDGLGSGEETFTDMNTYRSDSVVEIDPTNETDY